MFRANPVGIALGRSAIVATVGGSRAADKVAIPLAKPLDEHTSSDVLEAAFASLREQLPDRAAGSPVDIALMPPFVEARCLSLPRLRTAEALQLVRRNAGRYFLGVGDRTFAIIHGLPGHTLAVAAPTRLVESVHAAARSAGLQVRAVVPAHAAWLAQCEVRGAVHRHGAAKGEAESGGRRLVVAVDDGMAHLLAIESSALTLRRVVPRAAAVVNVAGQPGSACILAEPDARDHVADSLRDAGWNVVDARMTALECAAAYACRRTIEFLTPSMIRFRRERARSLGIRFASAVAALLVTTAGLQWWGAHRELDAVRSARVAIHDSVASTLLVRDSLDQAIQRVRAASQLILTSPRVTPALLDLAVVLPHDTYITRLNASDEVLEFDAVGGQAGAVLEALGAASYLTNAGLHDVVERRLENGSTISERFHVITRLTAPTAAATSTQAPR